MNLIVAHPRAVVFHGDCADTPLPEHSVDALVTDPPAGIGFMGKAWDGDKGGRDQWVAWLAARLARAYVAMKPGAHGLVWALPRTSHWTALAIEAAGFEIRDRVSHLFGTGFPKSLTSASAEIPEWSGTALKPACEDWWLIRKPLEGSVEANFARYGTGVLNIGGCRLRLEGEQVHAVRSDPAKRANATSGQDVSALQFHRASAEKMQAAQAASIARTATGRWPAHVVLDEDAAEALDAQSGVLKSGDLTGNIRKASINQLAKGDEKERILAHRQGDTGGASRFFYVAKGSRTEKDAGLDHLTPKSGGEATGRSDDAAGVGNPRAGAGRTGGARNFHPTVKSIALMRWLVRLVTPPGGVVLDPFAGSGTTGVAALAEGCSFVGVEHGGEDGEYLPIIEGRINHAIKEYVK